ncbi:hypothetical protein B0H17DRAFT_1152623 [Mycena rosella]|uniref:Uncharacterized protein n=1 Tax=Mycena rosella TaxID=1033263 RepID=A0AAD7BCP7_MYCRO|nr:hypothetical protein B0H17DRAFT_1152623 [Mycena rosella]
MSNGMHILLILAFVQIASRTMLYHFATAIFVANTPRAFSRPSESSRAKAPRRHPSRHYCLDAATMPEILRYRQGFKCLDCGASDIVTIDVRLRGVYAFTLEVLNAEPMTLRTQVSLTASPAMKRCLHGVDYKSISDTIRKFRGHVSPLTDPHRVYLWLLRMSPISSSSPDVDLGKEHGV